LKLSIIIPVYNEERFIVELLNSVISVELDSSFEKEIIIVDDGSVDHSVQLIKEFALQENRGCIKAVFKAQNEGKGRAIKDGLNLATGDYCIIQDADLEYNPSDYNKLLELVLNGKSDVVYGSRFLKESSYQKPFKGHRVVNGFLTKLSNCFTGFGITDLQTCYKLFKTDIVKGLTLKENGFGFETEVTIKLARIKGIILKEVPISYCGRSYLEDKKINWRDGVRSIYCMIVY
jgi:glycosyltransferase involved in cell wall biosynthesis